jgi:plasmid stabilization system protein ParE
MRVVWTRAAARDVRRAYDYLADFNPAAAVRVADALYRAGDGLTHFPSEAVLWLVPTCANW